MLKKPIIGLFAILLALGLVTATTIYVLNKQDVRVDRSQWPTTQATVQSSSVSRAPGFTRDTNHITVEFSYELDNIHYSTAQSWDVYLFDRAEEENYPGATIIVYYNPSDHGDAVIQPSESFFEPWQEFIVFIGFITVILLIWYGVHILKHRKVRDTIKESGISESQLLIASDERLSRKQRQVNKALQREQRRKNESYYREQQLADEVYQQDQEREEKLREDQQYREQQRVLFKDIGVTTYVLERHPFGSEFDGGEDEEYEWDVWLEVNQSPILWIRVPEYNQPYNFYVTDARISVDFPRVTIWLENFVTKSFPFFGKVINSGIRWAVRSTFRGVNEEFSSIVAEYLNNDKDIMGQIVSCDECFHILSDPNHGCWIISKGTYYHSEYDDRTISRKEWDCYQAVAKSLLEIPIS